MSMMGLLSRCALAQIVGESTESILGFFTGHFSDRSRRVIEALHQSSEKAWKALEVSLAGETLWNKLDPTDEKALRQQVRSVLDNMPLPMFTARAEYRKLCLQELQDARRRGHLLSRLTPEELGQSLNLFARQPKPDALIAHQQAAVEQMSKYLDHHNYKHLGWLVGHEVQPGQGLLVAAVQFFFRRAVENSEELRESLQLSRIEALTQSQAAGFQQLEVLFTLHGQRIEGLLEGVRGAVLDVREEQQRHGEQLNEIYAMLHQLMELAQMQHRHGVRPGATHTMRGPRDRGRVKELTARYEALPDSEKTQRPALLNSVALLQIAAGDTHDAQRNFDRVATLVASHPQARAQALFNAYHAALQRHDYPAAIEALHEAVALDPEHHEPFPFSEYFPECILGAGGFGVVFKCQHTALKRPIVVKTLWLDGLDRGVEDVFREAQALNDLDHPAIVHLRDCRFADAARTRPFLVMDYFESLNLSEYVRQHGTLSVADLLPIARVAAEALQTAHEQGVLHRDVKPENLLVRREANGSWRVKLIDFGLALKREALDATVLRSDTPSGTPREPGIAGTADYAAPEQMGRLPGVLVGPYSDVYGFARTCYFALLGTPVPDDAERETLDERWRKLLSQCTARKVEGRLKDFTVVLERLQTLDKPEAAPPATPAAQPEIPLLKPAPLLRKGGVPPRYIEPRPSTPTTGNPPLPPLWAQKEPDITGATSAEDASTIEGNPPKEPKPKRGPLGGAFGSV